MESIIKTTRRVMNKGNTLGKKSVKLKKVVKVKIKKPIKSKIKKSDKSKIIYTATVEDDYSSDSISREFTKLDDAKDWLVEKSQGFGEGSSAIIEFSNGKSLSLLQCGEGKYAEYFWESY